MSDPLRLLGQQHARLLCPSPVPRACSNSCPFSQWCHPTISSFVIPMTSCLQSFLASGSFPMSQFFTSGGQSISASASVLPMNMQEWFPLQLTGLISLQFKGLSRVFSNTTVQNHQFFGTQLSLQSNSHIHTSVQFSSVAQSCLVFATSWTTVHQSCLSITNSRSLCKLMSIELVMPSNHLILSRPHLLLPSIFPSVRVFSNESVLHIRWPEYWSFSFSISPSNEYSGLISFRMDLLEVQGTFKSLLQHHSSKTSVLQCSAFFVVQLSHPYMPTGKTTALTRQTFVSKVMSLLFNMLSMLVIAFLPRSKHLLISWLQSPSAVILKPMKKKVSYCFHCFPIYLDYFFQFNLS